MLDIDEFLSFFRESIIRCWKSMHSLGLIRQKHIIIASLNEAIQSQLVVEANNLI